ncbi:hypothetical protein ACFUGD_07590 [Streptomyces sp. NPDC057217]
MRMELSDVTLDVEVSGEGPAVLLLHGFPTAAGCGATRSRP